jgi:hypothetical protein
VKQAKGNKLIRQRIANDDLTVHSLLLEKDMTQKEMEFIPSCCYCHVLQEQVQFGAFSHSEVQD